MGKLQSKHECFFVSADLNKALEDRIWKKKTGFNLANYNMDETLSELSICLEEKSVSSPLRVDLPPQKLETETSKVLKLDHFDHSNSKTGEKRLNVDEVECGVQLESSESSKHEWAFTLYDFDGHGRITKEDLSSLLKALYDAVGSSIKLPPNGAKTLKLRLSVGQDSSTHLLSPTQITGKTNKHRNANNTKTTKNKLRDFSKLNNVTRAQIKCTNQKQELQQQQQKQQQQQQQPLKNKTNEQQEATDFVQSGASNELTVTEQQQLASLVQENMERNHVKLLRRQHNGSSDSQQHKRRHRATHCPTTSIGAALAATTTNPVTDTTPDTTTRQETDKNSRRVEITELDERPKESQSRRNYYLDLAGVENNSSRFQNTPSVPVAGSGCVVTGHHHRSRSHDIKTDNIKTLNNPNTLTTTLIANVPKNSEKSDNVKKENDKLHPKLCQIKSEHFRSKSFDPQETLTAPRNPIPKDKSCSANQVCRNVVTIGAASRPHKFRPVSLGGQVPVLVSPHYHRRHRHRDRDHGAAMKQVAQWIEKEHLEIDSERLGVHRYEHHHYHEHHHHHHYHHYYEA